MVRFPDGTFVTAVPLHGRAVNNETRDFGLYMEEEWAPTWEADMIDWPDYGLPADWDKAAAQIVAAFQRASRGERVEVGCRGGLGRTGTVLACMAILAGVPANQAVEWVRTHYDPRAIETTDQEDWVEWFARQIPPDETNDG
jgi:protein-tyrosine phosphatase